MHINIEKVIWGLQELSDRSMQERLWKSNGNNGEEVSSFVEAACCTFDDSGLGKMLESGQVSEHIPPDQIENILRLSQLIHAIPMNLGPNEEIEHATMRDIRKYSAIILAKLHAN